MHTNRFPAVLLVTLSLMFSLSFAQESTSLKDKHMMVSLRMIGHELLLLSKDSTSRVLPVIEEHGRYRIQFDTEMDFNPDELVETVNRVVEKTELARHYIVEVEECTTNAIVYSFEMTPSSESDIVPCKSRDLPRSCYNILFSLVDDGDLEAVTQLPAAKGLYAASGSGNILVGLVLTLLAGLFIFIWRRKGKSAVDTNIISLGDYRFDKRNTELLIADQKIALTGKEADLLLLLYNDLNATITREVILERVWGDEGDYIGRTLDVFISKLRKKLEFDAKVKIVNIRGIGYKLVLDH